MIRASSHSESKFYQYWFMYRLSKLRGLVSDADHFRVEANRIYVGSFAAKQLLALRANADARRVFARYGR